MPILRRVASAAVLRRKHDDDRERGQDPGRRRQQPRPSFGELVVAAKRKFEIPVKPPMTDVSGNRQALQETEHGQRREGHQQNVAGARGDD